MEFPCDNNFVLSLRSSFPSEKILFPLTTEVVFAEKEYFSLRILASEMIPSSAVFLGLNLGQEWRYPSRP